MNHTLEKIKARLPSGEYFDQLCSATLDLLCGKFTIGDKYIFQKYFRGNSYAIKYLYDDLFQRYYQNDCFRMKNIKMPLFDSIPARGSFTAGFFDFIFPYLFNDFTTTSEGPYLYKNVQINKGDIVIDAGANIGLFSALASSLGAIVYAFEPVKSTREKYLAKTAQLNPNINVIPLALSNENKEFSIKGNDIGGATIVPERYMNGDINEMVQGITLDDWVKQNNISKIDFIKADIEGAERLMLEGAQWVLKTYTPKLAICTYHLPDDKKVLTNLILKANPNYKIIHKWKKLYAWVEK